MNRAVPWVKRAYAEEKVLYVNTWGGAWEIAARKNLFDPFTRETGIEIRTLQGLDSSFRSGEVIFGDHILRPWNSDAEDPSPQAAARGGGGHLPAPRRARLRDHTPRPPARARDGQQGRRELQERGRAPHVLAAPRVRRGYNIGFWLVGALFLLTLTFPYYASLLY